MPTPFNAQDVMDRLRGITAPSAETEAQYQGMKRQAAATRRTTPGATYGRERRVASPLVDAIAGDPTGLGARMRALPADPVEAPRAAPLSTEATLAAMRANRQSFAANAAQINPAARGLLESITGLDPTSVEPRPVDPLAATMPRQQITSAFSTQSQERARRESLRQGQVVMQTAALAHQRRGMDPLAAQLLAQSSVPMQQTGEGRQSVAGWTPQRPAGGQADDALSQVMLAHMLGPQNYAATMEAKGHAERNANQAAQTALVGMGATGLNTLIGDPNTAPEVRKAALAELRNVGGFNQAGQGIGSDGGLASIPATPSEHLLRNAQRQAFQIAGGGHVPLDSDLHSYLKAAYDSQPDNLPGWDWLYPTHQRLNEFLKHVGSAIPRDVAERWFNQQKYGSVRDWNPFSGSHPTYPANFRPAGAG